MVYGYARVSTKKQAEGNSLEAQDKALKAAGAKEIFVDVFTGTKTNRPKFMMLIKILEDGDTLIVTKLDRFARSIGQANEIISELIVRNVKINVLNMGVIDNSPTSKLTRSMLLAFAEFERDMIVERTQEGKSIARNNPDYRDGRPFKYTEEQMWEAVALLDRYTLTEASEMTGISKSTISRARKRLNIPARISLQNG